MNLEEYNPNQNREKIQLNLKFTCLSPLSHIGESVGNQSNLRELKVTCLSGEVGTAFAYSGNSLRNKIIRRIGIDDFLTQLNVQVNPTMHRTLFCGGSIDGSTGNDLETDLKIRQLMLPLSLVGTAKPKGVFGTKDCLMVGGRIQVGDAYLQCYETAELFYNLFPGAITGEVARRLQSAMRAKEADCLEALGFEQEYPGNAKDDLANAVPYLERELRSSSQWMTWVQKTRLDSLHSPELAIHLAQAKLKGQSELALEGKGSKSSKKEARDQRMIMGDWLIQPGATLWSRWDADITPEEEGYLVCSLAKFLESPYLGGKTNTGNGLVKLEVFYKTKQESGIYLSSGEGSLVYSDRAYTQGGRYQQYLSSYKRYLERLQNDPDLVNFLEG